MERPLNYLLRDLLDKSGGLGAGIVDANGLLLQSHGSHGGKVCQDVASHLSHVRPATFRVVVAHLLEGELDPPHVCYVRWLLGKRQFIYVMVAADANPKVARRVLRGVAPKFETLLSDGSGLAVRQRLEQPRQFTGRRLVR